MIGVYKITNPDNEVYIGASKNIKERFNDYKYVKRVKRQIKVVESLKKHGYDNHKFEVLEECDVNELNCRERHYQEFYMLSGLTVLNLVLNRSLLKPMEYSEETRGKMSEAKRNPSDEARRNMSEAKKGKPKSEEAKLNMRKPKSEEHIAKIKKARQNTSEETRLKMSESQKGNPKSEEARRNMSVAKSKVILNTMNGVFYKGVQEAADSINVKYGYLYSRLSGTITNNTNLIIA